MLTPETIEQPETSLKLISNAKLMFNNIEGAMNMTLWERFQGRPKIK